MTLELDHFLQQYADLSEEHASLAEGFRKKVETITLDKKRLSRLVIKATTMLANGTAPEGSALAQLVDVARALPPETVAQSTEQG